MLSFSYVIPAFNNGRGVLRTLDSVAAQSLRAAEVVVVDDGSTDDTADIAADHALRPHVIRQENCGAAVARRVGAEAASSSVVVFADSGDLCMPMRTETFLECFERYPEAVAATARVRFETSDELSKWYGDDEADFGMLEDPLTQLIGQSWPIAIAMNIAIRREIAVQAARVPPFFRAANDYALQVRCAEHGGFAIAREPTVLYESTAGGISQRHGLAKQNAFALVAAAQALHQHENSARLERFRSRVVAELGPALVESAVRREWPLVRALLSLGGTRNLHPRVLRSAYWHMQRLRESAR